MRPISSSAVVCLLPTGKIYRRSLVTQVSACRDALWSVCIWVFFFPLLKQLCLCNVSCIRLGQSGSYRLISLQIKKLNPAARPAGCSPQTTHLLETDYFVLAASRFANYVFNSKSNLIQASLFQSVSEPSLFSFFLLSFDISGVLLNVRHSKLYLVLSFSHRIFFPRS